MIVLKAKRLEEIKEYYFSSKLQEIEKKNSQGRKVINLGIGNPDMLPPENVLTKTANSLFCVNSHGYSSSRSSPQLRKAMSIWLQDLYKIDVNFETELLPLLGSKEGIFHLSMALLDPEDIVLAPNPGYLAYAAAAQLVGAKVLYYNLKEENKWAPDFEELEKMNLSKCKIMWLNYPHMPTGSIVSEEILKKLVSFARKKNIHLCNDNPYSLILNKSKPLSLLSFDPNKDVCSELNSLSKSFNMAGWRVGMLSASSEVIEAVVKVKSNIDSGMFPCIQEGAIEALKTCQSWHNKRNEIYQERRAIVWKILDFLRFSYDKDQVGLFVWAKAPESLDSVELFVEKVLTECQVFFTPGVVFGSNGKRFLRISLCADISVLKEVFLRILRNGGSSD